VEVVQLCTWQRLRGSLSRVPWRRLDGWFHGKSEHQMDDARGYHDFGKPHIREGWDQWGLDTKMVIYGPWANLWGSNRDSTPVKSWRVGIWPPLMIYEYLWWFSQREWTFIVTFGDLKGNWKIENLDICSMNSTWETFRSILGSAYRDLRKDRTTNLAGHVQNTWLTQHSVTSRMLTLAHSLILQLSLLRDVLFSRWVFLLTGIGK